MAAMKQKKRKILIVIVIVLVSAGCFVVIKILPLLALILVSIPGSQPVAAPEVFPATDILYAGGKGLGFMKADSSGQETFRFRALGHSVLDEGREIHLMTGDHRTLITVYIGWGGGAYKGSVYSAHPGEMPVACGWSGIPQLAPDQLHLWMGTEQGQEQYRLADCGTGNPPVRVIPGAFGILSPDERYSVEPQHSWSQEDGNKYSLMLHDLRTGKTRVIGEGNFPAWSRDGQWLAYTGPDGIYVTRTGFQEEPRRVVRMGRPSTNIPLYDSDRYPPAVSWSPDGRWLVYHVYINPPGQNDDYYSIMKASVETGETVTLLDDTMFPYWIWPVEKP